MGDSGVKRRLAAILAADVASYTRLMEEDSEGTVTAWRAARDDVVDPGVAGHSGRVVKLTGDGFLAEFPTVHDAVQCAITMQERLAVSPLDFRMGINLGDIIDDGRDIHGEGVNVAARLEAMAEPGGICVSGDVYNQVRNRVKCVFEDLGEKTVKNVSAPIRVYRVKPASPGPARKDSRPNVQQDIRFCMAPDGVQLAFAVVGQGPPLVKAANWMNHLEYDWDSPVWSHVLHALAADHTLIRYDQRGNGLSDWDADEISFDAFVSDLETVIEAAGLDRFDLLGISQGCAHSVAYAIRNPGRVQRLILYGGFARGRMARGGPSKEEAEAMLTLVRTGWGQSNPAFRQMFTTQFLPEGTTEQFDAFNELQRVTTSPENAAKIMVASRMINVTKLLPQVTVPTLVLHGREDAVAPFDEGRRLAAGIPGAKFVALESKNHLMLEDEPAWPRFLAEVRAFLAEPAPLAKGKKASRPAAPEPAAGRGEKPAIAVLPFANISGDPDQEYFADGMTEDIITELSRISGLLVIARNTALRYKHKNVSPKQVGQELDVAFLLEGSVRKAQNRVRLSAHLVDAETDSHIWTERFDRGVEDIFAIQNEVARSVAEAMDVDLSPEEEERIGRAPTDKLDAYDLYLRTRVAPWPPLRENTMRAQGIFQEIIDADPEFANGHAGKAMTYGIAAFFGHNDDSRADAESAVRLAARAIEIDDSSALAHDALAFAHVSVRKFDEAVAEARKAVELQPGSADGHAILGLILCAASRCAEGREEVRMAMRLDPQYVAGPYLNFLGAINIVDQRYKDAIDAMTWNLERGGTVTPTVLTLLAVAYSGAGQLEEARKTVKMVLDMDPDYTIGKQRGFFNAKNPEVTARWISMLRAAGLSE